MRVNKDPDQCRIIYLGWLYQLMKIPNPKVTFPLPNFSQKEMVGNTENLSMDTQLEWLN